VADGEIVSIRQPAVAAQSSFVLVNLLGRLGFGCLSALVLLVIACGPVEAHSVLVSSDPSPGEHLTTTPGQVVLRFSEPLNQRLSRAFLLAPGGERFPGRVASSSTIDIRLPVDVPGPYTVRWRSVSILDGHTLNGGYTFGVGAVAAGAGSKGPGAQLHDSSKLVLWIAVLRFVEDGALLLGAGMLVVSALGRRDPILKWVRLEAVPVLAAAVAAGVTSVVAEAARAAGSVSPSAIMLYLSSGLPGKARVARLLFEVVAVAAAARHRSRLAATGVAGALIALAAGGHAAGANPAWWGIAVDGLHLLGAAVWAGGILALRLIRPPEGWRSAQARELLDRFSPVALTAFSISAVFGIFEASKELDGLHSLFDSKYGLVLEVKVLAIGVMLVLSVLAWRRVIAPRSEGAPTLVAIVAAVVLAGLPGVPAREAAAALAARTVPADPALPRPGDLTLGGRAGDVLVGLTLRPARPGRNDVFVYLLPLAGEDAASRLHVSLRAHGKNIALDNCGPACRRTGLDLHSGERIGVRVGRDVAPFQIPRLPAPNGAALFARAEKRMHAVSALRLSEVFGPGNPPVHSTYRFQAPDRMSLRSRDGFESVWVGSTRYIKDGPHASWFVQPNGPPLHVPYYVWDYVPTARVDPRIVGTEVVNGKRTTELSFYGPNQGAPVWFRLWIDRHDYVQKAEMRAEGHFMNHLFSHFNAPNSIRPPVAGNR
jgi:copper transport protein